MKGRVFHPLLFAAFPVVASYAGPGKWQPLGDHVRPLAVILAGSCLAWLALARLMRSPVRAALALSAFLFVFFSYGEVNARLKTLPFWPACLGLSAALGLVVAGVVRARGRSRPARAGLAAAGLALVACGLARQVAPDLAVYAALWVGFTLVCAAWAAVSRQAERLVPAMNAAGVALVALPLISAAPVVLEERRYEAGLRYPRLEAPTSLKPGPRPDVYHFVLDGYGRADALDRTFMFDNRPFLRELESRGFYVAEQSRSNYSQTEQSLASGLNGAYLHELLPGVRPKSRARGVLRRLVLDNAMARTLQARGYEYVPISTGFAPFNRDSRYPELSDPPGLSVAEGLILHRTPEAGLRLMSRRLHDAHRTRIERAFSASRTLPKSERPRYVLVHVLAPHPPFVFDRHGRPVQPSRPFGLWDCDMFVESIATHGEYTQGYPEQLRYVNRLLLETVDRILAQSPTRPVIVLQGDHGSRRGHDLDEIERADVGEAFANLTAVLGPPEVGKGLYPSITPVNLTHALLAGLAGAEPKRLPDRSYYSTWDHPFAYTDVTARVELGAGGRVASVGKQGLEP